MEFCQSRKVGTLELFPRQGYRTGYIYHEPVLRQDRRRMDRANSEVEIPPTATSFSDTWDGEGP